MSGDDQHIKDNAVYVEHMRDCIQRIDEYVESKAQFYASRLVQDAVIRNLQVMAESSQKLSEAVKKSYPKVPWKSISGFRNILAWLSGSRSGHDLECGGAGFTRTR